MSSKFIDKMCRICLGDKELFNWNKEIFEFSGTTYKDCYYNFIHLNEVDSDLYPDKLCEMCGNELRNAHFLFERSLESFYILQNCINSKNLLADYSDVDCMEMQNDIYHSAEFSEHPDPIDNENQLNNSSCISDNIIEYGKNELDDFQQILFSNVEAIDPGQFENIQKFESSSEVLMEHQLTDTEKPLPHKKKRKRSYETPSLTSKHDINDDKLPKSTFSGNSKETKKYQSTSDNTLEQNLNEECETTTYRPAKVRRKYILICQYCSLEVNGASQLKIHEASHSENRERTHTCTKCGLKLYLKTSLNEHMKIHDENRQKHKCDFCEKEFYNKGGLNVHKRIHLGLMFKCQICSKEYFRQIDLDRHLPSHSIFPLRNVVKKRYAVQCKHCNKTVLTHKLKEHMAIHSNQPQMKCKICDKPFYCRTKCINHLRRLHRKDKSEYDDFIHHFVKYNNLLITQPCKQRYQGVFTLQGGSTITITTTMEKSALEVDGANQLKKHEATHSENRERTHTCTKCGVKLYSQSGLNEHMKIHDENRQKKHKCEFCDKAFYNKGALNVHRRIHLGLMLKCQICSKEYFRQIDLDRHLPSHSISPLRNVVKKRYAVQCKHCNKTVLTRKLKEHMAIHSNQPQMKCKICDKPFYCRAKCINHLRRLHRKDKSEYDDFIHNFVEYKNRMSFLKIKQEENVHTIIK